MLFFYFVYQVYILLTQGVYADGTLNPDKAELWSLTPFWNDMTSISALIGGATVLCFSFTGFDALSSLAEETKDAEKNASKSDFLNSIACRYYFYCKHLLYPVVFP